MCDSYEARFIEVLNALMRRGVSTPPFILSLGWERRTADMRFTIALR